MQTFSLYVRDMSCSGCSNAVKQRLEMLPDVYHVNVDIIEGSATVYYRESNELLYEIQHLVDEFGYLGRSELVPDHQCLHDKNIIFKNSKVLS